VEVFERFLVGRKMQARGDGKVGKGKALEECAVVRSGSRRSSVSAVRENERGVSKQRRRIADEQGSGEDDDSEVETEQETEKWKLAVDEKSGRLSGLYNTYILVRPYRYLRMIFVSQAARNSGKFQQRYFLAHATAPP
jgi:hypothetical protein